MFTRRRAGFAKPGVVDEDPPWRDYHAIWLLKTNDPNERPPPPTDVDPSSRKTPADFPQELVKQTRNIGRRAAKK